MTEKVISQMKALHGGMQAQVAQGTVTSKGFSVTNRAKQGCVLAPVLFSMYLSAMLEVAFTDSRDGIYIQTCQDAYLFTMSQLKA